MDGFMDKIAQKLGAQEAIRANAAADAAQIERLEAQVKEYDACIKEMRKLNLRNAENEQKLKEMLENVSKQVKCALEQSSEQIGQLVEQSGGQIGQLIEQSSGQIGQLVEKSSGQIGQLMEQSSEQIGQLVEKSSGQIEQITEECIAKLRGAEEEEADKAGKGGSRETFGGSPYIDGGKYDEDGRNVPAGGRFRTQGKCKGIPQRPSGYYGGVGEADAGSYKRPAGT